MPVYDWNVKFTTTAHDFVRTPASAGDFLAFPRGSPCRKRSGRFLNIWDRFGTYFVPLVTKSGSREGFYRDEVYLEGALGPLSASFGIALGPAGFAVSFGSFGDSFGT